MTSKTKHGDPEPLFWDYRQDADEEPSIADFFAAHGKKICVWGLAALGTLTAFATAGYTINVSQVNKKLLEDVREKVTNARASNLEYPWLSHQLFNSCGKDVMGIERCAVLDAVVSGKGLKTVGGPIVIPLEKYYEIRNERDSAIMMQEQPKPLAYLFQ